MMDSIIPSEKPLQLNVGLISRGPSGLSVMNCLQTAANSRLKLKLLAIAPQKCASCYKYAGEMGIEVFEDYRDLLTLEPLDLVLDLTGDAAVMAEIVRLKRASLGVMDRNASMQLFDLVRLYSNQEGQGSEITLAKSFAATMLEASPDGVLVIDKAHRIVDCNHSVLITGSENKDSIIGKFCFNVIYGSPCRCDELRTYCPADEAQKTGKPARSVHEISGPENKMQIRQVTAYPIRDLFGETAKTIITVRDITKELGDRIELHTQALKKNLARVAQEDRLASLGRLVASVCHEINNPITSIVTFTKLIRSMIQQEGQSDDMTAKVEHYLDLSFKEAMRCGSIVKNLLTFARPKSVEAKLIDVSELVGSVMLLTTHQFKLGEIECKVDLPPSPFTAWGDFGLLQQVLLNLIFNAIDAMPGGGFLTISGGTFEKSDNIWLTVSDTGHGVDRKDLGRIFEPFFSTKTEGKGVGLGLSMVYSIIRAHNGTVDVESELGKGTTFKIELPRNPSKDGVCDHISNMAFPVVLSG